MYSFKTMKDTLPEIEANFTFTDEKDYGETLQKWNKGGYPPKTFPNEFSVALTQILNALDKNVDFASKFLVAAITLSVETTAKYIYLGGMFTRQRDQLYEDFKGATGQSWTEVRHTQREASPFKESIGFADTVVSALHRLAKVSGTRLGSLYKAAKVWATDREVDIPTYGRKFVGLAELVVGGVALRMEKITRQDLKTFETFKQTGERMETRAIDNVMKEIATLDSIRDDVLTFLDASPDIEWRDIFNSVHASVSKLNELTGLESVKKGVADTITQIIDNPIGIGEGHMNMLLVGPPGTGKTMVATILQEILYYMYLLPVEPSTIKPLSKADLVASFEGQTVSKTRNTFVRHLGRVMFVDEAYQLTEGGSQFGQEALDELVGLMQTFIGVCVVAMAGYEGPIRRNLFEANAGLERRFSSAFTFRFVEYTAEGLFEIFIIKAHKRNWYIDPPTFISEHDNAFSRYMLLKYSEANVNERKRPGGRNLAYKFTDNTDRFVRAWKADKIISIEVFDTFNTLRDYIETAVNKYNAFYNRNAGAIDEIINNIERVRAARRVRGDNAERNNFDPAVPGTPYFLDVDTMTAGFKSFLLIAVRNPDHPPPRSGRTENLRTRDVKFSPKAPATKESQIEVTIEEQPDPVLKGEITYHGVPYADSGPSKKRPRAAVAESIETDKVNVFDIV